MYVLCISLGALLAVPEWDQFRQTTCILRPSDN